MSPIDAVHLLWALKRAVLAIERRERHRRLGTANYSPAYKVRCEELAELLAEVLEAGEKEEAA